MFRLDMLSLLFVAAAVALAIGIGMLVLWHRDRSHYLGIWGGSFLMSAAGYLLAGLRDTAPDWLSVAVGNSLLVAAYAGILAGAVRFVRKPVSQRSRLLSTGALALVLMMAAFLIAEDDLGRRIMVLSAAVVVLTSLAAWHILRHLRPTNWQIRILPAASLLTLAATLLLRIAGTWIEAPSGSILAAGSIQTLSIGMLIVTNVGIGIGLACMHVGRLLDDLEDLSRTDPLTGLDNRRALALQLTAEFVRVRRTRSPLALMMIDIDHFKQVNDTLGHAVGDEALRQVARSIRGTLRPYDLASRYGGEEFCVVLPHTALANARETAERIRRADLRFGQDPQRPQAVTLSIGLTEARETDARWEDVVSRADAALYEAKRQGRDRVVVH